MKSNFFNAIIAGSVLLVATGCQERNITMQSMRCEFVKAGGEAVIFGSGFSADDEIFFENNQKGEIVASKTNDSILTVIVPEDAKPGKLCYVPKHGNKVYSDFMFRDNRGMIIDFDSYPSTWGGFEPFDEEGEPIRIVKGEEDNILTLPATPPEEINNHYGLLYGVYKEAWSMNGKETFLQYCANPEYGGGGRGNISIAGDYSNMPIEDLCLKFEVYIPKECTFKCRPRVEIFFGPYESANKHGRELSPIYAWAPCESNTDGFYTKDGWETISVPLTEFNHSYESDEIKAGPINLKTATNFSFVIIGDPGDSPSENYLCVDNFRIVPIK
ncbi:MAG: hypothetical protein J6Y11_06355 [Paludibacteraceae bacterium]|nr:hypothetical protein [Paludibacteraceae bacterium]